MLIPDIDIRYGVKRLWIGGIAEDVGVCATVLDALGEGFEVVVIAEIPEEKSSSPSMPDMGGMM